MRSTFAIGLLILSSASFAMECPVLQDIVQNGHLKDPNWLLFNVDYIPSDHYVLKQVSLMKRGMISRVTCEYSATASIMIYQLGLFSPIPQGCDRGGNWASDGRGICFCAPVDGNASDCSFVKVR